MIEPQSAKLANRARSAAFVAIALLGLGCVMESCKSTGESETKDLKIIHKDGTVEDTNAPTPMKVAIYAGLAADDGKIVFEGMADEPGQFVYYAKNGARQALQPTTRFLGKDLPFRVDFRLMVARSQLNGAPIPDRVQLVAQAPVGDLEDTLMPQLRAYNTMAEGSQKDELKLCFRDDTCDVAVDLQGELPQLTIDFKNNLLNRTVDYIVATDLGFDVHIHMLSLPFGGGTKNPPLFQVTNVKPGSPAAASGLPAGALLTNINREDVRFEALKPFRKDFVAHLNRLLAHDPTELTYFVPPPVDRTKPRAAPTEPTNITEQKVSIAR